MSLCSSVRCCAKVLSVVGPVACIHETAFSQVGGSVCGSTSCTCRIRPEEQRIILTISVYIWVSWRWHVRCEILVLHCAILCIMRKYILPYDFFSPSFSSSRSFQRRSHPHERAGERGEAVGVIMVPALLSCPHQLRQPSSHHHLFIVRLCRLRGGGGRSGGKEGSSPSFRPFLVLLPPSSASPFLASLEEPRQGRAERVTNKSGTREGER